MASDPHLAAGLRRAARLERNFAQPLEKVKVLSTARQKFELTVSGIHWDELDEDISVAGLLVGRGDATRSTKIAAPSSIILAVAALRFLYKITLHKDWRLTEVIPTPKKPQNLPIVPSPEEVLRVSGLCVEHQASHDFDHLLRGWAACLGSCLP
jgi:hypothetical protein